MPDDAVYLLGSEDEGVPQRLLAACAHVLAIPMYGINHSFPVSVASGMVLVEHARRRDPRARLAPLPG
jgi:tRNA G18 (ribose-2'-O)-methylase SpoU